MNLTTAFFFDEMSLWHSAGALGADDAQVVEGSDAVQV